MDVWKQRLIHLDHCRGVGWQAMFRILQDDPELIRIYHRSVSYWQALLKQTTITNFLSDLYNGTLQEVNYPGVDVISFLDTAYPKRLSEIYQSPWLLYCVGDLALLQEEYILAVIGTRKPTDYGVKVTKALVPDLVKEGIVIASGLAKGIDGVAQNSSLVHNGKVIGVIAGGCQHIYPKENIGLARDIAKHGLLLSEYPPIRRPEKWQFPMRNRLISGISRGILVVEGKRRSGTMITIQQGLEQGKDIFAVPGSVFTPEAEGPLSLVKDGAKLVTNRDDILNEWHRL